MIEYLLKFENEAAAKSALPDWLGKDEEGNDIWIPKPQCGILPTEAATPTIYDRNGNELTAKVSIPGFYIIISLPKPDRTLVKRQYVLSSHKNERGRMVKMSARTSDVRKDPKVIVQPVFAGSNY